MDVDRGLAERSAASAGARSARAVEDVLEDPSADAVAVRSPNGVHAEQVIAACAAGMGGILCEKPLATTHEDALRIKAAVRASNTAVVVGTMHAYDPAVRCAMTR